MKENVNSFLNIQTNNHYFYIANFSLNKMKHTCTIPRMEKRFSAYSRVDNSIQYMLYETFLVTCDHPRTKLGKVSPTKHQI